MLRVHPVLLAVILIGWVGFSQTIPATGESMSSHAKFDPIRDPAKDLREAVARASQSGKRILLDVGGEWCIWCHRLDSLFIKNPDLDKYLNDHFVVVKVNVSKQNKNESFLAQYPKVPGYPHLFVLDETGRLLQSQDTGVLESGKGHDPEKVFAFLKKWAKPEFK